MRFNSSKVIDGRDADSALRLAVEYLRAIDGHAGAEINLADELEKVLTSPPNAVDLSIVLPVFNEDKNISELYRRLSAALAVMENYEIIFINDGSTDSSAKVVTELHADDTRVKLLNLSRNFGHQAAISAGLDHARGRAVIVMDADLQDPPELIPQMLEHWCNGAEVVFAVRRSRREFFVKRAAYFVFYRFLQFISNVEIPLDSGDFCLMDRKIVQHLKMLPERNRFLRGLRSWIGYQHVALPYDRESRYAGEAKYTFRKLVRLGVDGILSFSTFPLRLAVYTGLLTCLAGGLYLVYVITFYYLERLAPQGWTSLISLVLLIGGVQLVLLGIIGEYIARIYDETKQRPNYIVRDFLQ